MRKDVIYISVKKLDKGLGFNNLLNRLLIVLCCFLLFAVVSCKPKENRKSQIEKNSIEESIIEEENIVEKDFKKYVVKEEDLIEEMSKSDFREFKNSLIFEKENTKPIAHEKYLDDEFEFKEIPGMKLDCEKSAVVGSYVCKFYPNAKVDSEEDLKKLPKGIEVPFATILPIYGEPVKSRVNSPEEISQGMDLFTFENNFNWFYHTKWNGEEGLVFGADLAGINNSVEINSIISLQYSSKGVINELYPILGYNSLSNEVKDRLSKDKLAFEEVSSREYNLDAEKPDDMIALYLNHRKRFFYESDPIFITTDLMAHTKHLVFDRILQHSEEVFLFPKMWELSQEFLEELEKVNSSGEITANEETLQKAKYYFQVANALCELAPTVIEKRYSFEGNDYKENDAEKILEKYDDIVKAEIKLINEAKENTKSPIFTFADGNFNMEDYTQYKPRGHYTKNKVLEAYFKAMMWYGRIHFAIATSGIDSSKNSDLETLSFNMEPIALFITEIVRNNGELYQKWRDLFDPITDLIGLSDDLSFEEVLPLWESYNVKDFKEWSSDNKNLLAFIDKANKELRPPSIASSSVFYTKSDKNELMPPMGWRLFGQRFTFDSEIHFKVSTPRVYGRSIVKGVDIMTAFGSKDAEQYLIADYKRFPKLKEKLNVIERNIKDNPEKSFSKTYYGTVLNEIALQARFEKGSGFYFTESDAWNKKALLSSHGTWSELRHDTILYVKQTCSEMGWGGDFISTFRIEPIPTPIHYIEPNLAFWKNTKVSLELLLKTLKSYQLATKWKGASIEELIEVNEDIIRIVELECEDKEVSKKDINFIGSIPDRLAHIIMLGNNVIIDASSSDELQMASVADVFSNPDEGVVLEVGSGIPYRIYIPLNDRQGGKRIAVGYCFNYYEFTQPISNRLNDEQWKAEVYSEEGVEESKKPEWARNIALPLNTKK